MAAEGKGLQALPHLPGPGKRRRVVLGEGAQQRRALDRALAVGPRRHVELAAHLQRVRVSKLRVRTQASVGSAELSDWQA